MKTTMICATSEQDDELDDLYFGSDAARIGCSRHQSVEYVEGAVRQIDYSSG